MMMIWAVLLLKYVVMFYRRVFGHPVPQDIQDSVGCRSSDHKLFVTVSLICWETCRKYREISPWAPVTVTETSSATLSKIKILKICEHWHILQAAWQKGAVGRSVCTSAGEGHPSIFFLGRCALIGSSCSDSKCGGSRQGTAVVI